MGLARYLEIVKVSNTLQSDMNLKGYLIGQIIKDKFYQEPLNKNNAFITAFNVNQKH